MLKYFSKIFFQTLNAMNDILSIKGKNRNFFCANYLHLKSYVLHIYLNRIYNYTAITIYKIRFETHSNLQIHLKYKNYFKFLFLNIKLNVR